MADPDLHTKLRSAIEERQALAQAATPGPWSYNSYSLLLSVPLLQPYENWDTGDHSCERYGSCLVCGEWREPPYLPSPSLGHGCRLFNEEYERHPEVARVPPHHGDTAIGRHQADAKHIEANSPNFVIRACRADLDRLQRHAPAPKKDPDDPSAGCLGCGGLGNEEWGFDWRYLWPCPEVRSLASVWLPDDKIHEADTT